MIQAFKDSRATSFVSAVGGVVHLHIVRTIVYHIAIPCNKVVHGSLLEVSKLYMDDELTIVLLKKVVCWPA